MRKKVGDKMADTSILKAFVAGVSLALAWPAIAADVTITQLTAFTPAADQFPQGATSVAISQDGSTIAFSTDTSLVAGESTNGFQNIFVMNSDGTGLRQLTHGTGAHSRSPKLSADGSVVVFESSADLTGDNPPEPIASCEYDEITFQCLPVTYYQPQPQIFVMNTDGTGLRQLTHGVGRVAVNPDISGDGTLVVFESDRDLVPGENTDVTKEVFAIRADGTGLVQLTVGDQKPAGSTKIRDDESRNAVISRDGTTVAFDSFQDLTPPLNDDRSDEVFVFDLAGYLADGASGNRASYTLQLTNTDILAPGRVPQEEAFQPSISADGGWIAFSGCINPWGDPANGVAGTNPALADVIFVVKRDGTRLKQLTFADSNDDDAQWPRISADGSIIIFSSESLLADGVDTGGQQQVFAIRADGTSLTQLTHGDRESGYIKTAISGDGTTAIFYATSDLTGDNADHTSEVFAATFALPVTVVAPQEDDDGDDAPATASGDTAGDTSVAQSNSGGSSTSDTGGDTGGSNSVASTSTGGTSVSTGATGLFELLLMVVTGLAGVGAAQRRRFG